MSDPTPLSTPAAQGTVAPATDLADIVHAVAKHINKTRFKRLDSFLFKGAKDPDPSQVDEATEIVDIVRRMIPASMLPACPSPEALPASGVEAVRVVDWLTVAKSAGNHGVRYRTNRALEAFLTEIAAALTSAPAPEDRT